MLVLPTTGRYYQVPLRSMLPRGVRISWCQGPRRAATASPTRPPGTCRAAPSRDKAPGSPQHLPVTDTEIADVDIARVQRELTARAYASREPQAFGTSVSISAYAAVARAAGLIPSTLLRIPGVAVSGSKLTSYPPASS